MNPQSLEEYLVSIGWHVDKASFNEALGQIKEFKDTSKLLSMNAGALLLKAGAAFVKLGWQVTQTIFDMTTAMAETDITVERFARATASSEETARAYMRTMQSLGKDATSFKDLFLMTNEEYARFKDIFRLSKSLEAPQGLQDTLVSIRDIQHEFNKMKIILQYAGDWFVYFLADQVGAEVKSLKDGLYDINKLLQDKIQPITQRLAQLAAPFVRIGIELFNFITKIVSKLIEAGEQANVLDSAKNVLESIESALSTIFELVSDILGLDGDLSGLAATFEVIAAVLDAIATIINGIVDSVKFVIALLKGQNFVDALSESYTNTVKSFESGASHIGKLFGSGKYDIALNTASAYATYGAAEKAAQDLSKGQTNYNTSNKTLTQNNTFNVNGAKDPAAVGSEVYRAAIRSADNSILVGD